MKPVIYADSMVEAVWFRSLSPLLSGAACTKVGPRGGNPKIIDELIRYDRPDIILLIDGQPALVVEKTREVPTGHNVGQRIARLVCAVELGIPIIKFVPFDARKHGDHTAICNLNIRLIKAFQRMTEIHRVPVLAISWPADVHGELVDDGTEDERPRAVVHDYLTRGLDRGCPEIRRQLEIMEREYRERLPRFPSYAKPPPSVSFLDTPALLRELDGKIDPEGHRALAARERSLVYTIEMTPAHCRREDPYTGMQFIYDYLWCRSGPRPEDKHTNLILRFPLIDRARWAGENPNDPGRKSCNWYLTASGLWFRDGIAVLR